MGSPYKKDFELQEKVDDNLTKAGVEKLYNAGHVTTPKNFDTILSHFNCKNGVQGNEDLGLIVLGYSWGARGSYELTKAYENACGRKADRAYMLDGIQKMFSQFAHAPIAQVCKNYYKTNTPIRGRALDGCENHDKTDVCKDEEGNVVTGMPCHSMVLQAGFKIVMEDIASLAN